MESPLDIASLAESLTARLEMEESLGVRHLPGRLSPPLPTTPPTLPPRQNTPRRPDSMPDAEKTPPAPSATRPAARQSSGAPRPSAPRPDLPVEQVEPILAGTPGRLEAIAPCVREALACRKCRLCEHRRQVVFGEGCLDTDVVFLTDMPGREEDLQGRPFQGLTGALLTQIVEGAFSRKREDVYLTTLLKCRPKGSRIPKPDEVGACLPYFRRELEIIRPRVLVAFGEQAVRFLQGGDGTDPVEAGAWLEYEGIPLLPTFGLSTILRERRQRGRGNNCDKAVWQHLQRVLRRLQPE